LGENNRDLYNLIKRIVLNETIYLRHYNGQVVNTVDPAGKGRVRVTIADLGFSVPSNGLWCSSRFLNSLYVPKIGDWLDVGFVNGDRDRPVYYGKANEIAGQLPESFDNILGNQVIFEDPDEKINIKFDPIENLLEIGAGDYEKAARENDSIESTSVEDPTWWTNFNIWRSTELAAATAYLATIAPPPNPEGIYVTARVAALTAMAIPASITGKITDGSDQVHIGDK
jgi:hypothetical protein